MQYKVLIADDNKIDADYMQQFLTKSGEQFTDFIIAQNKTAYLEALRHSDLDLILCDYRMRDFDGIEAIRLKNQYCKSVPLIIIFGTIVEEKIAELIREGAVDFLIKNSMENRLVQVAVRAIEESHEKEERQKVERSLQKSLDYYQMLFNTSLDGILIGIPDEEGPVIDANITLCDMLGYTVEEMKKLKRSDFLVEESETPDIINKRKEEGAFGGEVHFRQKNGELLPVEVSSSILELQDGEKRSLTIVRDISERKEAEKKLKWNNKRHILQKDISEIIDQNVGFSEAVEKCLKRINKFIGWSVAHVYFHERKDEESLYRPFDVWDFRTERDLNGFIDATQKSSFTNGEGMIGDMALRKELYWFDIQANKENYLRYKNADSSDMANGLMVPIVVNGQTEVIFEFYNETKKPVNREIVEILRSVSEQIGRLIEREKYLFEVEKEKEFVERVINSLPGLFYVLDENNNYERVNKNFLDDLGYSWEELQQMNPLDFYQEKDHEQVVNAIQKAFTDGEASIVSQLKTKDGQLPWYFLTGSHFNENGKDFILGTGIDITEQEKLEDLLQQAHELARIGAWEVDLVKNEINWTPVTKQIHEVEQGFEPDLETAIEFYKKGESREKIQKAVEEAIANGTPYDVELQIVTAKGNERWVRAIGKSEFRDGKCVRLYGSFQDIHEQKLLQEDLKGSLHEKSVLLQEVHHRVKNNLALISGILQLQAFNTDNEEVNLELSNSGNRIQSIATIHELLYQSENFSQINFKSEITKLIENISETFNIETDIEYEVKLEDIILNVNQAIPCALIINEVLTNIYKHAFIGKKTGRVDVNLLSVGNKVQLEIKDNGSGLPEDFKLSDQESLGFQLINTLKLQIGAEINLESDSEGTMFILTFKKEKIKGSASHFIN